MKFTTLKILLVIPLLAGLSGFVVDGKKIDIKSQRSLSIEQGQSITLSLSDLVVEADPELNYPQGFYLEIDNGESYTVTGSTVKPNSSFNGKLKVKVRVSNGKEKSGKFNLNVDVRKTNHGNGNDNDGDTDDDGDGDGDDEDDDDGGDDDDNDDEDDDDNNGGPKNEKPVIVGQQSVTINKNTSYTLKLSDLQVQDPDNQYPADFTLQVLKGDDYSRSELKITPKNNFTGALLVKVRVNDGKKNSPPYNFLITVKETAVANVKPVITAQASLTTYQGESITLQLTDLSVTDPDNDFPSDFTLKIADGDNYSVEGNKITPSPGFLGNLSVGVKVNDGKTDSDPFALVIKVISRGSLEIIGQRSIRIKEDSSYTITLQDLRVTDPSNSYPQGFTLTIVPDQSYAVSKSTITPKANFSGNLFINMTVGKGSSVSAPFQFLIVVTPVNDPPRFETFSTDPMLFSKITQSITIAKEVSVVDVDSKELAYAEIKVNPYESMNTLAFTETEHIRGEYDATSGTLLLKGSASPQEYEAAIRSITYEVRDSTLQDVALSFWLNDGKAQSPEYSKFLIVTNNDKFLDIPNGFTPNNDSSNDQWVILWTDQANEHYDVTVRVFNKHGVMLFESMVLENHWDGKFNGETLPPASYYYTVQINVPKKPIFYKGIVTILR